MLRSKSMWLGWGLALSIMTLGLAGCSGSDGSNGTQGPQGDPGTPGATVSASALNFTIDSVTVNSPPVVNFTVTNEDGVGYTGISDTDLRFNIAKLVPAAGEDTAHWQNYINSGCGGETHGSQERNRNRATDIWGELVNHNDGSYTYTFETDITNETCAGVDVSYQANLTHRLTIQQGNSALPQANVIYDFVPGGGAVSDTREIVMTANCNECHDKITAHGSRFETKLCVTCHNPGTAVSATETVDFKYMIHKIHMGENLPSGNGYKVGSHDFSDIALPQDIRNCTKCHDGADADTPQGDNWEAVPSLVACGSCHDNIDFTKNGSTINNPTPDPNGHKGGANPKNSECPTCHRAGGLAGSVAESHTIPGKAEREFFTYKILEICGTAVDANPSCPPGTPVTMKFAVIDENSGVNHQYSTSTEGNAYNINSTTGDPEFTSSAASLNMLTAWDTSDYTNVDNGVTGSSLPARAFSVNLRTGATDNLDGTFTVTGATVPATGVTGSGAVAIEGHPTVADGTGAFTVRVAANSVVAYYGITDTTPVPRRTVVDVPTKCDRCHESLDVHGANRNNNGQLCVMCHNPSNTDAARRPKDGAGALAGTGPDGKKEESIDFKRLIHGIHAAASSNFDGTTAHGFRSKGLVVYGFSGQPNDFSHIRFPGVLSKCSTCHLEKGEVDSFGNTAKYDTYVLEDHTAAGGVNWEVPTFSGIHGSTVDSAPNATDAASLTSGLVDQTDDFKYSPISSVCSACHDSDLERAHMGQNGGIMGGANSEQSVQAGNIEGCPVCHGPGKLVDVEFVHDQAFQNFLGEVTATN